MPIVVSDPDDPRIEVYRSLQERAHQRDPVRVIAESERAVERLLVDGPAHGFVTESVLATPARMERIAPIAPPDVPLYQAELAVLREVVGFDMHRGCVASARRPASTTQIVDDMADRARLRIVVAEGVRDPANLGALIRNCRAFAVDLLAVDEHAADPFSRRAIRASMGNAFALPILSLADLGSLVARVRDDLRCRVLAATPSPTAQPVGSIEIVDRIALLVGSEDSGLSAELRQLADAEITVPIDPSADSLNVAAASAVLLHGLRPHG